MFILGCTDLPAKPLERRLSGLTAVRNSWSRACIFIPLQHQMRASGDSGAYSLVSGEQTCTNSVVLVVSPAV